MLKPLTENQFMITVAISLTSMIIGIIGVAIRNFYIGFGGISILITLILFVNLMPIKKEPNDKIVRSSTEEKQ